ncbi:MAG: c-type cytochrome [Saprospiraceae bacterium]|nr:c-type cytochrome [Saprospiraceae bacterium]
MKISNVFLIFVFLSLMAFSCRNTKVIEADISDDFDRTILNLSRSYFDHLPDLDLANMSPENRKIVELGKKLFYEKKLSGTKTISCASCHDIAKYGVDNRALSPGDKNQLGLRNSQSVLNTFMFEGQNWDTKFKNVEEQAAGPIFSKLEMAMPDTSELIKRLNDDPFYVKAFTEAFPDSKPSVSLDNIKIAIGSFERTLLSPSRFDDYLKGDLNALTTKEKLGAHSFVINCKSCHSSALVGGGFSVEYPIFGYHNDYSNNGNTDKGKYEVTKNPQDMHVFKVPQLRNVEKTYPYMHDGSVKTLEDAIRICAMAESNMQLKDKDVEYMTAFLKSLTGKIPVHALEKNKTFD